MATVAPLADDSKHDRLDELETSPELHHAHNGHDGGEGQKPAVAMEEAAGMQAPEFLRHMSMEDRLEMEKRLRWKIDLRLMPAVIIMYIMNYIDRCVFLLTIRIRWAGFVDNRSSDSGTTSLLPVWPISKRISL